MFTVQNFIYTIIILINIFLGINILRNKNKNKDNSTGIKIFALLQFLLAYWALLLILINITDYNIWVSRFVYFGPILIPLFLIYFVWFYPTKRLMHPITKIVLYNILPIPVIIYSLLLFTDIFFIELNRNTTPVSPVFNPTLYLIYIFFSYGYIFAALILFLINFRKSKGFERLQLRYLIIGTITTAIIVLLINFVFPAFNIHELRQMSPFAFLFFDITTFLALSNQRLFSIRTILSKTIKVLILGIILFLIVYGVRTIQDRIFQYDFFQVESLLIDFVLCIAVSIFLLFYIDKFRFSIGILARERGLELSDLINKLDKNLNGVYEDEEIISKTLEILKEEFPKIKINFMNPLKINRLIKETYNNDVIITQEIEDKEVKKKLEYNKIAIISIIDNTNSIVFSDKLVYEAYTKEELDIIERITFKLRILFERNKLYEDVKNFSNVLQDKVNEQTKELRLKYEELEKANQRERDMLDILGHELRTPIAIARNAISFVLSQKKENKLNEENLNKYLDMADENIGREIKLLETMLSATKIDNSKLELKLEKVDMIDVIHDTLLAEKGIAKDKGLKIEIDTPNKSYAYVDRVRIQEIVDNLVNNAVKYTEKGNINILLKNENNNINLSIKDTGIGISKEDLKRIGKKFYRANNYIGSKNVNFQIVRPGGTGLGLYVVFELVKAMKGKITIESELGKGSTFNVVLPKYTG